ncbi:MAG: hypothetical protein L0387_35970 [Acidobacteria bacterium]|nr:hypothetical protein [Acidobacteriota bacterium]MCI0720662.1 hypothetical protein [Acidobacteriota bacterium]
MKRSSLLAIVVPLLSAALWSPHGFAADITLFTGVQNPGKLTINNVVRDTKLGGVFGARFSGGQAIGFEQTFGFSPKFLESDQRAFNTQSNLLVGIPAGRVVPYATAGVGLITTFGDSILNFSDFGTKFTVNYGGGIKFRNLGGPVGFRVDVRGYSVPGVFSQTLNFVEGTIGLLFSF